ncbi:hypothetical protein ABZ958_03340 [Streptomyces sp. NPDC046237]|uniref:hypothetical protein n=1 Tax=Streptomyces sp. NPDC046237 TaxID=3154914 RepID=UPI0033CE3FC5
MRRLIPVFSLLALVLVGLYLGPTLARIAGITELQAGLIVGAAITWAVFQIDALVSNAQPEPTRQQN